MPSSTAARQSNITSPTGAAAAVSRSRCVAGERPKPPVEAVLDATRQRLRRHGESTRQLRRCQPSGQLQQGQRVATGLRDEPVADPLIQPAMERRLQQQPRIRIPDSGHHELRESSELLGIAGATHREHHGDGVGHHASRHELQRLHRSPVQPLHVVDQAHQRPLDGRLGEQRQDRQTDQEAIRRAPFTQPERGLQRILLRTGQALQPIQHRRAELMQPGERELRLRLDASDTRDATPRRRAAHVVQQRALADPRLTAQDHHGTMARPHLVQQPIQRLALAAPAAQGGPGRTDGPHLARW
jgi:hypothetical protein